MHLACGGCREHGSRERKSTALQQLDCVASIKQQCAVFGFPLSQGNAEALDKPGWKTEHRLISYFLDKTSAKKLSQSCRVCQDYSKSKVGRFLRHGVYRSPWVMGV